MTHVYLTQTGNFTAQHSHQGTLAEGLHTHQFIYEVTFYGPLNKEGYLLDFRDVQQQLEKIVSPLKNKDLSQLFKNPTTENICIWLYNQASHKMPYVKSVRVAEEPDRWIQVGEL